MRAQGKEMEGHLSSLLSEVHGLGSEFSVFQREAAELVGGHKRNRQTLKHHMQARGGRKRSVVGGKGTLSISLLLVRFAQKILE